MTAPLELPEERMRALGYRVVDLLVEHRTGLPNRSVGREATRRELDRALAEPLPRRGTEPEAVLDQVMRDVLGNILHLDHPRFFGFIPGPSNFVGALADALVAGFNPFAGTWLEASGPAEVELVTIDWLAELMGLPEGRGGLCVSGGSAANLTALALARESAGIPDAQGVMYVSDQTHSSVMRAARAIGLPHGGIQVLRSDDARRLDPSAVDSAIRADLAQGRRPLAVVATAGTTNTGSIDPLGPLADVARRHGVWLHVDAAYGGAIALSPAHRPLLTGIERADSIALDPHKWLFQPYELGCLLVRDALALTRAFHTRPEYLRDITDGEDEPSFADYGLQLTRSFRALKLWMTIKVFGADALGRAVAHGIELAELAEAELRRYRVELVSPAQLGTVCFRFCVDDLDAAETDELNERIAGSLLHDGQAVVLTTVLDGRPALRMCTINPRTTEADIVATVSALAERAAELASRPSTAPVDPSTSSAEPGSEK